MRRQNPIKKISKILSSASTKDDIQKADKNMKRCLMSSVIGEMQIKP